MEPQITYALTCCAVYVSGLAGSLASWVYVRWLRRRIGRESLEEYVRVVARWDSRAVRLLRLGRWACLFGAVMVVAGVGYLVAASMGSVGGAGLTEEQDPLGLLSNDATNVRSFLFSVLVSTIRVGPALAVAVVATTALLWWVSAVDAPPIADLAAFQGDLTVWRVTGQDVDGIELTGSDGVRRSFTWEQLPSGLLPGGEGVLPRVRDRGRRLVRKSVRVSEERLKGRRSRRPDLLGDAVVLARFGRASQAVLVGDEIVYVELPEGGDFVAQLRL